ncbi:unnamed protein product, partial [Heterosigma akashiwo]
GAGGRAEGAGVGRMAPPRLGISILHLRERPELEEALAKERVRLARKYERRLLEARQFPAAEVKRELRRLGYTTRDAVERDELAARLVKAQMMTELKNAARVYEGVAAHRPPRPPANFYGSRAPAAAPGAAPPFPPAASSPSSNPFGCLNSSSEERRRLEEDSRRR